MGAGIPVPGIETKDVDCDTEMLGHFLRGLLHCYETLPSSNAKLDDEEIPGRPNSFANAAFE